ncbi:MAG: glutaredoxin family protein, partial [Patescibacteria group bacterium]
KTVTVYSTTHCGSCASLKKWLDSKGVEYQNVNLEERPELQAEVIAKSGSMQVPVTIIADTDGNEQVVNGPKFADISSALGL